MRNQAITNSHYCHTKTTLIHIHIRCRLEYTLYSTYTYQLCALYSIHIQYISGVGSSTHYTVHVHINCVHCTAYTYMYISGVGSSTHYPVHVHINCRLKYALYSIHIHVHVHIRCRLEYTLPSTCTYQFAGSSTHCTAYTYMYISGVGLSTLYSTCTCTCTYHL